MTEQDNFDRIVGLETTNPSSVQGLTWKYHGIYRAYIGVKRFICGPARPKIKATNQYCDTAETLISSFPNNPDGLLIETSEKLLNLHRTLENTEARRRLEKWARKTIIFYLSCVFILVLMNGASRILWPHIFTDEGFISDTIMTVILSTTTVNIISLGVIIVKGHFPQKDKEEKDT